MKEGKHEMMTSREKENGEWRGVVLIKTKRNFHDFSVIQVLSSYKLKLLFKLRSCSTYVNVYFYTKSHGSIKFQSRKMLR